MKNLIGGLFETQEGANLAHNALQNAGFASEEIHVFVRKPRNRTARAADVRIQDIAKNALIGAFILGIVGGLIGFLVGIGKLPLPYLNPSRVDINPMYTFVAVISGIVAGVLTGTILGVASRLLRARETAEVTTRQIEKSGVLVTVNVNDTQSEAKARRVLEENGALEVGDPSEQWDLDGWSSPNGLHSSLRNFVNTR
jgi:outer membrane lipoprotein SlyB